MLSGTQNMQQSSKMFQLKRMNALTHEHARIVAKLAKEEPVSPKSLAVLAKYF